MFDSLKDLYKLKKEAAELQKQLEAEKISTTSSDGLVNITLNGSHELIDLQITRDASKDEIVKAFKEAYNKAQSELKNTLARKFQGMI